MQTSQAVALVCICMDKQTSGTRSGKKIEKKIHVRGESEIWPWKCIAVFVKTNEKNKIPIEGINKETSGK